MSFAGWYPSGVLTTEKENIMSDWKDVPIGTMIKCVESNDDWDLEEGEFYKLVRWELSEYGGDMKIIVIDDYGLITWESEYCFEYPDLSILNQRKNDMYTDEELHELWGRVPLGTMVECIKDSGVFKRGEFYKLLKYDARDKIISLILSCDYEERWARLRDFKLPSFVHDKSQVNVADSGEAGFENDYSTGDFLDDMRGSEMNDKGVEFVTQFILNLYPDDAFEVGANAQRAIAAWDKIEERFYK